MNNCWDLIFVKNGSHNFADAAEKFINSDKLPAEEDCSGVDGYAFYFIYAASHLIDFIKNDKVQSLENIEEVEQNFLDHFLFDHIFEEKSFAVTDLHESQVKNEPRMRKLHEVTMEERNLLTAATLIQHDFVNELRKKYVFDLRCPIPE